MLNESILKYKLEMFYFKIFQLYLFFFLEILSKLGYFYQQNDDVYRMWFIGIPYVFFKKLHHIEVMFIYLYYLSINLQVQEEES